MLGGTGTIPFTLLVRSLARWSSTHNERRGIEHCKRRATARGPARLRRRRGAAAPARRTREQDATPADSSTPTARAHTTPSGKRFELAEGHRRSAAYRKRYAGAQREIGVPARLLAPDGARAHATNGSHLRANGRDGCGETGEARSPAGIGGATRARGEPRVAVLPEIDDGAARGAQNARSGRAPRAARRSRRHARPRPRDERLDRASGWDGRGEPRVVDRPGNRRRHREGQEQRDPGAPAAPRPDGARRPRRGEAKRFACGNRRRSAGGPPPHEFRNAGWRYLSRSRTERAELMV